MVVAQSTSDAGLCFDQPPEGISVRIDPTGKIFAQLNAPFWGNSPETVVTQVLAEQFTVHPSDITIGYADSDAAFNGFGPGGSRFTVMVTGAIVSASMKLKAKIKKLAGHMLEANEDDLEFRDGKVGVVGAPGIEKSISDVALMANFFRMSFPDTPDFDSGLETTAVYDHPLSTPPAEDRKHLGIFYPIMGHMCHVAVIEVDVGTGKVTFLDYSAVHDAGTIVNPITLGGHIMGGTAMGVGTAMLEEFHYDANGQLINASFQECTRFRKCKSATSKRLLLIRSTGSKEAAKVVEWARHRRLLVQSKMRLSPSMHPSTACRSRQREFTNLCATRELPRKWIAASLEFSPSKGSANR
jgi:CO/xanthine dehydrogenase Mo-binding subunit